MPNRSSRLLVPIVTALVLALAALVLPTGSANAATTGTLAGTVTGNGVKLTSGTVAVFPAGSGTNPLPLATYDFTTATNPFSITLAAGSYEVRYSGSGGGVSWAPEWWSNSPTRSGALNLTITAGGTTTTNVDLAAGGSIGGSTVPGARVDAYQSDAGFSAAFVPVRRVQAQPDGSYQLTGLAAGSYRMRFFSTTGKEGWWTNGTSLDTATSVPLSAGGVVTGINPTLQTAGTVSGSVIDPFGKKLNNVKLELYEFNGVSWVKAGVSSTTNVYGTFKFFVPRGGYRMQLLPETEGGLRSEFWFDAETVESALNFSVSLGQNTPGINSGLSYNTLKAVTGATLTGTLKVGQTLKATAQTSSPAATSKTYRWLRNGHLIPGAKASTFKLTSVERGKQISVRITLYRSGYQPLVRTITKAALVK